MTDRLGVSGVSLLLALAVALWPVAALPIGAAGWAGSSSARGVPGGSATAWAAGGAAILAGVVGLRFGWPVGVALAVVLGTLLRLSKTALRHRRERAERVALGAVLGVLARELHAGTAPREALEIASTTAGDGLSRQLRTAVSQTFHVGSDPPGTAAAPGSGPLDTLVCALRIADRHGVPPADLVEVIAGDVVRAAAADEVRIAQTAGPRFSGFVLGALPLLGVLLGTGIGADPAAVLLGGGTAGSVLLVVGTSLVAAGLLWSARIVAG